MAQAREGHLSACGMRRPRFDERQSPSFHHFSRPQCDHRWAWGHSLTETTHPASGSPSPEARPTLDDQVTRPKSHASSRSSPCFCCNRCIPARESGAERRQGLRASLQALHARRAWVRALATPDRARPTLDARSARMSQSGPEWSRCRGPAASAANHCDPANPTPSLVLPVAIQLDSPPQAIPARPLAITRALSWAVLAVLAEGQRRPTARPVADWAVGPPEGDCDGNRGVASEDDHAGWATGVRALVLVLLLGAKRPAAGRPAKSPSHPLAVASPACLVCVTA
ncbi:hypothetical protein N431DRAFT_448922 [Stipitochalara longipes BDJ]|nr:hypothetical protein N431DRAFT_448922 [Stipitochalara longipes BDJ]